MRNNKYVQMKKLLILGGNATETVIVEKAKELGVYTIVTDNHEDWSCSPAMKDGI